MSREWDQLGRPCGASAVRSPQDFATHIEARLADLGVRSESIKQDALAIALEVSDYVKEVVAHKLPSKERDAFIAGLANLQRALTELAAVPPMRVSS
jgi:hypothetical protein